MKDKLKKIGLQYGNYICILVFTICLLTSDQGIHNCRLIGNWLGYIGCLWSFSKFIHFWKDSRLREKIPMHIRTWYPLYLFFFYPLSKFFLAFFNLNWRTNIDFTIYILCASGIVIYFLYRIFKDMPILVSTVILIKAIPYIFGVLCLFYLSAATMDGEEIEENGQRYVISQYSDLMDEQPKKYKIVDPCFRSLFAIEYDIDHIDGN